MISGTLKGLLGRKFRAVLTALAIVLGVAMVSGTYVLTDTISAAFDNIFSGSYKNTSAVISGKQIVKFSSSGNATVPESLLGRVTRLPDVEAAAGQIFDLNSSSDYAKLIDRNGKAIGGTAPTFGFGFGGVDSRFNPLTLLEGRWASGPTQIVIDAATAKGHDFGLGDRIGVSAQGPIRNYRITGIAKFGNVDSLGGATFAIFDVATAQERLHKQGVFDAISVASKSGVSPEQLKREIQPILPPSAEVKTGAEQAKSNAKDTKEFTKFIQLFLLAFGGIALFVGAFVIFNTLSITVAQRSREFATLRTLGASRRQVLRSVIVESLALGLAASLVGLALGVALAKGLSWLMATLGMSLPQTALVIAGRTAVVALVTGTAVTVLAGILPAFKATHVPPIAAVREGAPDPAPRLRGQLLALGLGIVGALLLVNVAVADGGVISIVGGSLLFFVGVAALAKRLVPGLVRLVGRPADLLGGFAGQLAKRNALRNPARTASTAAALMIGLALVTFVAVLAHGLVGSDKDAVAKQVSADYVVQSANGWSTFPRTVEAAVQRLGSTVSAVRYERARVGKANVGVDGVDANVAKGLRFDWKQGSDATLASLGAHGAVVRKTFAKDQHLRVGDSFLLQTPTGRSLRLTVRGIYDPPALDQVPGGVLIGQAAFDRTFLRPQDVFLLVNGSTKAALAAALKPYPEAKVFTRDEFVKARSAFIGKLLNMVYVLLGLSVIVSLFGMVNTLVLSVFERTRELGMLRAVGMSRRQTRRMVRHESVITALIGAALGLPLGIFLAALLTQAMSKYGIALSIP